MGDKRDRGDARGHNPTTGEDKPSPLLWTVLASRFVEQVMRVVRRSVQGDHPTPGRGQAIAPTMDEPGNALRSW